MADDVPQSRALSPRFEHDRLTVTLKTPKVGIWSALFALGVFPPVLASGTSLLLGAVQHFVQGQVVVGGIMLAWSLLLVAGLAALCCAVIAAQAALVCWHFSDATLSLSPHTLGVRWHLFGFGTGRRTIPLESLRSAEALLGPPASQPELRLCVRETTLHKFVAEGADLAEVQWLASEILAASERAKHLKSGSVAPEIVEILPSGSDAKARAQRAANRAAQ